MERNIVLTVFGLFSFGVMFIFGLTHSYHQSQSSVKTKVNAKAILPCPVFQEVVSKDGGYAYVQWYICTSEGSSCDGEAPRWNWTAGMNEQGGQMSKRKGTSISSDGSLNIKKVHLHDITKYMCKVSRDNAKSPLVYYVTLTMNENGTDQTTTDTVEISTRDPKTQDCKYTEVSCESLNHCSGHGNCIGPNVCTCNEGFKGYDCSEVTCESLNNCSNHGDCTGPNECTCVKGFQGAEDCSEVSCESLNNCSGNGNCSGPNVCTCHEGFKGFDCSEASCESLNNCSNHGACIGPNECTCEKGFQGEDCSEEGGILERLSTPAVIGISVGLIVLVLMLFLLLCYYCKRRRIRPGCLESRPQRKDSTEVYSVSQFPSSNWVFSVASESCPKEQSTQPVQSYQNPTYSTAPLYRDDSV